MASPIPRPTTAVMMGRPIATRLPSTRLRITIAATMPTSSLCSVPSVDSVVPIEPAAAVLIPILRAGSVASITRSAMAVVSSPEPTLSSTGANAVCSSLDSRPAVFPELLTGLVTLNTCCCLRMAFTDAVTACLFALSVSLPCCTSKTIWLTPFCCGGNRFVSRSFTCWLPVPGRVRSLLVCAPNVESAVATPTATSAQMPITIRAWRALNRPSRCSSFATGPSCPPACPRWSPAWPGDSSRGRPQPDGWVP